MTQAQETLTWVAACPLESIPEGQVKAVRVQGEVFAVVREGESVYALENTCPHRGGPLAGGKLIAGEIACPWHGFRFDPKTGAPTMPADHPMAKTRPVRVHDGVLEIACPPTSALSPDIA